jgi:hypothetical protein
MLLLLTGASVFEDESSEKEKKILPLIFPDTMYNVF